MTARREFPTTWTTCTKIRLADSPFVLTGHSGELPIRSTRLLSGVVHAPQEARRVQCAQHLPMCLLSSLMKETQNLRISLSDLPLGSKSAPPLPPPMLRPVRAFLKIC